MAAARRSLGARLLRGVLGLLAILLVSALLLEGGFRFLLFSDSGLARKHGARLRRAANFAEPSTTDEYWKLMYLFSDPEKRRPNPNFDPVLGWLRADLDPATYAHPYEGRLGTRRPILLYGDSFAECVVRPCWEELVRESEIAREHLLLNYGAGGYGFGQIVLCMLRTLDRFADRDPVVIVSLLIDSDMDRSMLEFRGWPKPRYQFAGQPGASELVLGEELPPDNDTFLESHPVGIRSYAWRYLLHGTDFFGPERKQKLTHMAERFQERLELNGALIEKVAAELDARGLEYFFLLFHGEDALQADGQNGWQEAFLTQKLDELGVPYVSSKHVLRRAAFEAGRDPGDYYIHEGPGLNHYTAEGNRVVFEAIVRGLHGEFRGAGAARRDPPALGAR